MKTHTLLGASVCLVVVPVGVLAQDTWCYTNHPDAIFCDDFDRYCNGRPPWPGRCPDDYGFSMAQLRAVWASSMQYADCGTELWGQGLPYGDWYDSPPFSVRYPCQGDAQLGQNYTLLMDEIQRRFGGEFSAVLATDEDPLVFEYVLYGQTVREKILHANAYMELCTSEDRAPTNFVMSTACGTTGAGYAVAWDFGGPFPVICAQEFSPAGCPPIATAPQHASIAVGCLAFLDTNPCDSDQQSSANEHLAFFDGRIWYSLRSGLFPGDGDFLLQELRHNIRMTIKSASVVVEMRSQKTGAYSWCEIPRNDVGVFNTIRAGFGFSCEIDSSSWTNCANGGRYKCIRAAWGGGWEGYDNVVVYGGVPYALAGIARDPQPASLCGTGTATFTVGATGTAPLAYQWQKNGVNLTDEGHYSGVTTAALTISNADASDLGNYRCVVSNTYSSTASADASLTIYSGMPPAPTDGVAQVLATSGIRWKWFDTAVEAGYRVKDAVGENKSGDLAANTIQWDETAGIAANTQYTRRIYAFNGCGESAGSTGQSRYSWIETPTGVAFGAVATTSIVVSPRGTLSNLASGGSGVRTSNTTTGANSGWQSSQGPWTSSGLTPNTPYTFVARARNGDGVETTDCVPVGKWTLSVPPGSGSVMPGDSNPGTNRPILWTAVNGFGAGKVQYYLYAWDQSPTHVWTGVEALWVGGTITTTATSEGPWYLHVRGYNGEDVANGTYDYTVTARKIAVADLDADGDVDLTDFSIFQLCFGGPNRPVQGPTCVSADLDGDTDVDLADFGVFQACFNGPNRPPACD
jgi:hypothetical protein